uniref:Uncharacterized protein n=1 Tax=Glossina brevipalpis TaxID=37001 RepID=A0A1A9WZF6_9MUSC
MTNVLNRVGKETMKSLHCIVLIRNTSILDPLDRRSRWSFLIGHSEIRIRIRSRFSLLTVTNSKTSRSTIPGKLKDVKTFSNGDMVIR